MSDFGDRIRDARVSARPAEVGLTQPPPDVAEAPPRKPHADNRKRSDAPGEPRSSACGLEHRCRLEELSRKINALNAALVRELLRQPGVAEDYPRTIAALADELAERATSGTLGETHQNSPSEVGGGSVTHL